MFLGLAAIWLAVALNPLSGTAAESGAASAFSALPAQAERPAFEGLPPAPTYIPGTIITPAIPPATEIQPEPRPADEAKTPARRAPGVERAEAQGAKQGETGETVRHQAPPLSPDNADQAAAAAVPATKVEGPTITEDTAAMRLAVGRRPAGQQGNAAIWEQLRPLLPEPGDFAIIPGSALTPVLVKPDEFDFCKDIKCFRSAAVLGAWNGGAFDALRGEFRVHGGGHADYGGNEVYVYDLAARRWTRETDPQPLTGPFMQDQNRDGTNDSCPMPASGPPATHSYQGFIYVPKIDRYWLFGTVGYCDNGMGGPSAWEYDAKAKSWSALPEFDDFAKFARLVVDRRTGNVLVHVGRRSGWHEIDPVSRKVVRSFETDPFGGYIDGPAVFDPLSGVLFAIYNGRDIDRLVAYDWPDENESALQGRIVAEWPEAGRKQWGLGLHASGLLVLWDGNHRIEVVDPDSGTSWVAETGGDRYASMGRSDKPGKVYSKWVYLPEVDAFLGITNPDLGMVLYRLGSLAGRATDDDEVPLPGDVAGPTPPPSRDVDSAAAPPPAENGKIDARAAAVAQLSQESDRKVPLEIVETASWAEICATAVLCDPMGEGDVIYRGKVVESGPPNREKNWRSIGNKMNHPEARLAEADPAIGGLRFHVPSRAGAGNAGNFKTNFSPDYSFQVGPEDAGAPAQEVYIQFQVRYSCSFIWTDCDPASPNYRKERRCFKKRSSKKGCTASKIALISTGDRKDRRADACTLIQTAINHGEDHHLSGFHRCPRTRGFGVRLPKVGGRAQGDAQPNGLYYCPRIRDDGSFSTWNSSSDTCFRLIDERWITIQIHLHFGPWQRDPKRTDPGLSHVSIWGAVEGQNDGRQRLVIDNDFYAMQPRDPGDMVGKIWLMPHLYGKDWEEEHPSFQVWYRNLVISRTRIPNPV